MNTQQSLLQHIAIIMDGNGRWAESQNLPRSSGHEAGAIAVKKIVKHCVKLGIQNLTLYSFSSENWNRPQNEIDLLMQLLIAKLASEVPELVDQGIRLQHIGRIDRFPEDVQLAISSACKATEEGNVLTISLALDYSGRSEIVAAIKRIAESEIKISEIDEGIFEEYLYTAGAPDPDLLIRTAGEYRVSNFLLWQIAYSELYVTDVCWPDFDESELDKAIESYNGRIRTYGALK